MTTFQIPGLDYGSDDSSPEAEEVPQENHMCIDCYSIAMKIVQLPSGAPVPDKYLVVHELTNEEMATFGNALKETDIDPDGDDFIREFAYTRYCSLFSLFYTCERRFFF
ncbi:unnamed protein product [Strongylus vulgaris]|uniref:Uncharacterized protein n=1 Tax=Strongylus vulgaris TaxID=40348 RepID=A0A3P7JQ10_STRVU|nr:unnamed protein product [Strongylus vulgaris]